MTHPHCQSPITWKWKCRESERIRWEMNGFCGGYNLYSYLLLSRLQAISNARTSQMPLTPNTPLTIPYHKALIQCTPIHNTTKRLQDI